MKLIRGAAGSGKTRHILTEFRAALSRDRNSARLVAPTATLVRHLRNELARSGEVFPPNAVLSLSAFAAERAGEVNLVSRGLLQAVVSDTLRRVNPPEFASVSRTSGLTSAVIEAIQHLENAGATPDSVRGALPGEVKALVRVWRAVDEWTAARKMVTRAGLLRRAAENTAPLQVFMDGFLAFSPAEAALIRSLATNCDLTLTLPNSEAARPVHEVALQLGAADSLLPGTGRSPHKILVEASSAEREADEIARRILHLSASGTAFREIAVAVRDSATYAPLLQATFGRFGIPARFYFTNPLETHPASVFLNGLIDSALQGWEHETALQALRAHPRFGHTADFDRFDFKVREHLPGHGVDALVANCDSEWLRAEITQCLSIERWVTGRASPAAWLNRMEQMARRLYRAPEQGSFESLRSHSAALSTWLEAIEEAADFWPSGTEAVSLAEFRDISRETLAGAGWRISDDRRDVVHVLQAYEARQWEVRALFVCGATDRAYPQRAAANPLLSEETIRVLRARGIPLRTAEQNEADERALVQSLCTRAADTLVFTCPKQDASGRAVKPTRLMEDFVTELPRPVRPASLNLSYAAAGAGHINSQALLTGLRERHREVGLTSLEKMLECRFRFFAERTLSLKSRPAAPGERLDPRVTGLIMHAALEKWQEDLSQDFPALFEQAFEEAIIRDRLMPGYRLELERLKFRRIAAEVAAAGRWNPVETQVEVSLSLEFPEGVTAKCRVDRIDTLEGSRCIVIDYKSGKVTNVNRLVTSATSLQGPLYARAVREHLGLETAAMIFWAVRDDKMVGWGEAEGVKDLLPIPPEWTETAWEKARVRLADYLSGQVYPQPAEELNCRWCDYADTCRVEAPAQLVRIAGQNAG